jgi:magnesium transporter
VIRALQVAPGGPPRPCDPAALPERPGGGCWCDLSRDELPPDAWEREGVPEGATASPGVRRVAAWLAALHPLTAEHLRRPEGTGFGSAQEGYLHARFALLRGADGPAAEGPLDLVVGPGFALTVHPPGWAPLDRLWDQLLRGDRPAASLDFAVYQLVALVAATYRRASEEVVGATERLVERLTDLRARHVLRDIVALRRRAAALRAVAAGAVDAVSVLAADGRAEVVQEENRPFYQDAARDCRQLLATLESARDTLTEAVEAYTSVQSTEMNRVMQIFTVVAVVFAPPTLIASIYGMNFRIPEYHWPWGYAWSLSLMAGSAGGLVLWLRRRHYL